MIWRAAGEQILRSVAGRGQPPHAAPQHSMMVYRQRAEMAVRALPPLTMPADRLALSTGRGAHGQRKPGPGDSFWQFRPFVTGDAESAIDWRRSARSDTHYVRQNEWEATQNVWLWCDSSPSMTYRSRGMAETKLDRAMTLVLGTAILLAEGGEKTAYLGEQQRPRTGRVAVQGVMDALDRARLAGSPSFPRAGELNRFAHVIIFGDFLDDETALKTRLAALATRGIDGHLVHIVDPAEEEFPFSGRTLFQGLESETAEMIPRAETVRRDYRRRMAAWCETLRSMARSAGWSYVHHRTDRPAHMALLGLMNEING